MPDPSEPLAVPAARGPWPTPRGGAVGPACGDDTGGTGRGADRGKAATGRPGGLGLDRAISEPPAGNVQVGGVGFGAVLADSGALRGGAPRCHGCL